MLPPGQPELARGWGDPRFPRGWGEKGWVKFWGEPVPRGVVRWNRGDVVPGSPAGLGLGGMEPECRAAILPGEGREKGLGGGEGGRGSPAGLRALGYGE